MLLLGLRPGQLCFLNKGQEGVAPVALLQSPAQVQLREEKLCRFWALLDLFWAPVWDPRVLSTKAVGPIFYQLFSYSKSE